MCLRRPGAKLCDVASVALREANVKLARMRSAPSIGCTLSEQNAEAGEDRRNEARSRTAHALIQAFANRQRYHSLAIVQLPSM